ncbi:hypothetical protein HN51_005277 [Arachis hypogaea]
MIHQPDPSVAVGDFSQNDKDAKNSLQSDYELIASEGSSEESDANSHNVRGVYGCDRRPQKRINRPHKDDPTLTFFLPKVGYHALIEAFGGKGYLVGTSDKLKSNLSRLGN